MLILLFVFLLLLLPFVVHAAVAVVVVTSAVVLAAVAMCLILSSFNIPSPFPSAHFHVSPTAFFLKQLLARAVRTGVPRASSTSNGS